MSEAPPLTPEALASNVRQAVKLLELAIQQAERHGLIVDISTETLDLTHMEGRAQLSHISVEISKPL